MLAGGTIWVAARGDSDALVVALAVWMLGWIIGPMFAGGGDETLKPEYFSMLPLPPRTLAAGLLTAAAAGVAPIISLIALLSLVVVGAQLSVAATLIAVPALLLQLFCFVLASRLAVAVYGVLLQVRSGAVIAALVNAFILAFAAQGWALIVAFVSTDVQGTMARGARIAPSGWGLVAVEAAGRDDWLQGAAGPCRSAATRCRDAGGLVRSAGTTYDGQPCGEQAPAAAERDKPTGRSCRQRGAVLDT